MEARNVINTQIWLEVKVHILIQLDLFSKEGFYSTVLITTQNAQRYICEIHQSRTLISKINLQKLMSSTKSQFQRFKI